MCVRENAVMVSAGQAGQALELVSAGLGGGRPGPLPVALPTPARVCAYASVSASADSALLRAGDSHKQAHASVAIPQ
eukprot:436428-Pleurochrysis_carterae.AAC.1